MRQILYIDLFCGAGGTSTGVERARLHGEKCARVIACVNHDPNAIASHAANHPNALHFTEDIRTLDLTALGEHTAAERRKNPNALLVLWASLECTNFSKAKGGKPRDADSRTLAEHLFRYIDALQPDYIYIENVEEFMCWGDLDENGKPISKDEGRLYMKWVQNVCKRGYDFDHRLLNAANYGARTSRTRFFGIFAQHGLPIVFPEPTHCKGGRAADMFGSGLKKWNAVRPILNLDIVGQSIFSRKKPLSERTLERIYKGLKKFIPRGEDAFLSKQYSGNPDGKNISIDEPAGTITCIDHHALVQAKLLDKTPKSRSSLVTSHFFANEYSGGGQISSIDAPLPTVLTTPKQKLVTVRWLINTSYKSKGGSIDEPIFTLIARMDKSPVYLATAEKGTPPEIQSTDSEFTRLIKEFMIEHNIIDIYMRMLSVTELKEAQGFPKDYVLIGTQTEQKKYIGNAVEVNMSRVLCEALAQRINE